MRVCWSAFAIFQQPNLRHVLVGIGLMAPLVLMGEMAEIDTDMASPPNANGLDRWHAQISSAIVNTVERVDRFFGDARLDDENNRTRLNTSVGLKFDGDEGPSLATDFKLRLALPQLGNRLHMFVDNAFTADDPQEGDSLSDAVNESEPDTGLRYIFKHNHTRRINADVGARFSSPAQLFSRLQGREIIPFHEWELRLRQTVAWFTEDGWTETSEMTWNRPLENRYLFRSVSRVLWEEKSSGITPSQSLLLFKELNARSGYHFALSGKWPETPDVEAANYTAILTYRRLMYRQWLSLEISPGIEFPQARDYELNPFITIKCGILFSDE